MQTYSHSGAVPGAAAIKTVLAGAVTAVIGGIIYAYAFYWIPFVYVNFIITLLFSGAIGFVICSQATKGKIRNNTFVFVVAILCAVLGLYVYWGAYLWALEGIGKFGLWAFWPPVLYEFGQHLFENGSWGIKKETVTGWFLLAFWVVEAGAVLWFAQTMALSEAHHPFCESCQEWTELEPNVARLTATGQEPAWQQVLAGDLPSLAEFPPAPADSDQFVRLDVARCPRCEQNRFLSATSVKITVNKKGEASEKEQHLVKNAIVTPSQFAVVEACGQLYREGLAEAAADPEDEPPAPPEAAPQDA